MIAISHETPIGLLKESLSFNDYQYCLVHLLEEQTEYRKHFERCRDKKIPVLLDNSIFELEEAFEPQRFSYWVERLKPDEYIVPDVLEDAQGTINSLTHWVRNYSDKHTSSKMIGVVQGKTYEDIVKCYKYVDKYCQKIAISFNYSLYEQMCPHENKLISWAFGRIMLLDRLLREGVINTSKPHHLLGVGIGVEFSFYKNYSWIDSLDTSNPIVHGLFGIKYSQTGLLTKRSIKLCELIDTPIKNRKIIDYNIRTFRKIVNS